MIGLIAILFAELSAWGWLERNEQLKSRQDKLELAKHRQRIEDLIVVPKPSPFRLLAG